MNKAILIGRLGQDPRVANTQTGTTIVSFSLATDESYTGQDGNRVEKTEWHRVVAFGKQAEFCANYLSKGRLVLVEGSIQTRKWQDQEGQDRYTTEVKAQRVQALDPKGQRVEHQVSEKDPDPAPGQEPSRTTRFEKDDDPFGDVPF